MTTGVMMTLLQSCKRALLISIVLAEFILVYRWNLDTLPLRIRIPSLIREPKTLGLKYFVDRNGLNHLMPLCESANLGPILVDLSRFMMQFLEEKYPEVQGGQYSPPTCNVRYKVAIIVPYRNNRQQLVIFLNHMHAFLMKQKLGYGIFIVEQEGVGAFKYFEEEEEEKFNRGLLLNAGFEESRKHAGGWQCFIFHDINLLPLDERNSYSCPHLRHPRHHAAFIHKSAFSVPLEAHFGGVSAFTQEQFTSVNGFSNQFWGTGGEDHDMFYRLNQLNYSTARYNQTISRYAALGPDHESSDPKRQVNTPFKLDGLSNLKYRATKTIYPLYIHIMVNKNYLPLISRLRRNLMKQLND